MESLAIDQAKFKIPKFKSPLSTEEMIVIFMQSFVGEIMVMYKNTALFYLLLFVLVFLSQWSFDIMKNYTFKESIAIENEKEKKNKFFSDNFIFDICVYLLGSLVGYCFTLIFNVNVDYNYNINFALLFVVRLFLRYNYYSQFKF
jgi:hypothetical protein